MKKVMILSIGTLCFAQIALADCASLDGNWRNEGGRLFEISQTGCNRLVLIDVNDPQRNADNIQYSFNRRARAEDTLPNERFLTHVMSQVNHVQFSDVHYRMISFNNRKLEISADFLLRLRGLPAPAFRTEATVVVKFQKTNDQVRRLDVELKNFRLADRDSRTRRAISRGANAILRLLDKTIAKSASSTLVRR